MVEIFRNKLFLFLLALANFAAGFYSISYYLPQHESNSFWFWVFIADCPLYAILFGINLLLLIGEKPSKALSFISIVGNFKFGLWTIFVLLISGAASAQWLFVLSHLLLIIETIVLLGLFEFRVKHVLLAVVWFILNDYLDYVASLHPFVPQGFLFYAAVFALASTIILSLVLAIIFSGKETREEESLGIVKDSTKKLAKKKRWAKSI